MSNKHIRNTQFIPVTNLDWRTKTIQIKDKTTRTLKNGVIIPTALAMERKLQKYV